jgi:drug/metabolite transporter (DMT)-like permease
MAAYAGLAFLSFLWGSSFLLIKIASRAFDPLEFALARVAVAAAAMLLTSALSGKVWPGPRPGLWARLVALALIGQVVPFLLLGQAARLTTSADMALMMGAQPIFVFLFGRFFDRATAGRGSPPLASASALLGSLSPSGRLERIAAPIPYWGGLSL